MLLTVRRDVIDAAQREAMAHVAPGSFLRCKIAVVLWNGRLIHWRAEIGRVGQVFGKGVIRQKTETMGISAAHVHVGRVVPALCGVLQQVDRAHWKGLALEDRVGAARSENRSWNKRKCLERPAWTQRTWSGRRIVDQVRALQVQPARAEVADFDRCIPAESFLHGCVPLLDVLRWRMRIKSRETNSGGGQWSRAQHRRPEIETRREQRRWRREVVGLLRLWEDVRDVVALIAPRIQVNRRVEDAISAAQDQPLSRQILRDAEARREVELAGIHQSLGIALFPSDENLRSPILEN